MKLKAAVFSCIVAACALSGCGGGTEGTGGVLGDVPPDKAVGGLSSSEHDKLCSNIRHEAYETYSSELSCNWYSNVFPDQVLGEAAPEDLATWQDMCKRARPVCLAELKSEKETCQEDPDAATCPLDFPTPFSACAVSASDVADCLDETLLNDRDQFEEATCEMGFTYRFHPELLPNRTFRNDRCARLFELCPTISGFQIGEAPCNLILTK